MKEIFKRFCLDLKPTLGVSIYLSTRAISCIRIQQKDFFCLPVLILGILLYNPMGGILGSDIG